MSKLIFKDDDYTISELIRYRSTGKNIFQSGDVTDGISGEVMDIQNIDDLRDTYYAELKENAHILCDNKSRRLKWATTEDINDLKRQMLQEKYNKGTILKDDLADLIDLKKKKGQEPFSMKYKNFITLNIGKKLPNTLSFTNKGKFYDMLYYLAYCNTLKHTPRKNGRVIKKEDLMEILQFNNYKTYRKFINSLVKNNIVKELKNTNNTRIIIINPTYVNRNIRIDYTTYLCFKNDLQEYLSDEEKDYLEMLGTSDDLMSSYEIV